MARAGSSSASADIASHRTRGQLLNDLISDEMAGGARIEHRDTTMAVLARGGQRVLVIVDGTGTVRVERLGEARRFPNRLILLADVAAIVVGGAALAAILLDLP
jgi:hypothetical protein